MNQQVSRQAPSEVPLPALLYAIRGIYTEAIRQAQAKLGYVDVPASGEFILSAMEWSGASLESVIQWMGVTKQAVSQTVEMLVERGYLERSHDSTDRRRVNLSLTERGQGAGRAARSAIEQVDRDLRTRVGPVSIAHTRATLIALREIGLKNRRQAAQEGA